MQRTCLIGGITVQLLPLPPLEWVRVNNKLPTFLFCLIPSNLAGTTKDTDLEIFYNEVKSWLKACARVDGAPVSDEFLEHLSLPEAASAATVVSSINGFDEQLRKFFLGILKPRDAELNSQSQQPSTPPDARRSLGQLVGAGD